MAAVLTQLRWSRQNHRRSWTPSHFQDAFKIRRSAGNCAHARKQTT
jgi:hypothetical protein